MQIARSRTDLQVPGWCVVGGGFQVDQEVQKLLDVALVGLEFTLEMFTSYLILLVREHDGSTTAGLATLQEK